MIRDAFVLPYRDPPPPKGSECVRLWCEKCGIDYIPVTCHDKLLCECGVILTGIYKVVNA